MNIDNFILTNCKFKKIKNELDQIINNLVRLPRRHFFDPNGYFICFSLLNKPYIVLQKLKK